MKLTLLLLSIHSPPHLYLLGTKAYILCNSFLQDFLGPGCKECAHWVFAKDVQTFLMSLCLSETKMSSCKSGFQCLKPHNVGAECKHHRHTKSSPSERDSTSASMSPRGLPRQICDHSAQLAYVSTGVCQFRPESRVPSALQG